MIKIKSITMEKRPLASENSELETDAKWVSFCIERQDGVTHYVTVTSHGDNLNEADDKYAAGLELYAHILRAFARKDQSASPYKTITKSRI